MVFDLKMRFYVIVLPIFNIDSIIQLSLEARKLLVDSYVALRRGDTTPGSRVAYRMTVRQLEALIRLSEAIARSHLETQVHLFSYFSPRVVIVMHCHHIVMKLSFQVHPRHVRIAVRLLKTSVIRYGTSEIMPNILSF